MENPSIEKLITPSYKSNKHKKVKIAVALENHYPILYLVMITIHTVLLIQVVILMNTIMLKIKQHLRKKL